MVATASPDKKGNGDFLAAMLTIGIITATLMTCIVAGNEFIPPTRHTSHQYLTTCSGTILRSNLLASMSTTRRHINAIRRELGGLSTRREVWTVRPSLDTTVLRLRINRLDIPRSSRCVRGRLVIFAGPADLPQIRSVTYCGVVSTLELLLRSDVITIYLETAVMNPSFSLNMTIDCIRQDNLNKRLCRLDEFACYPQYLNTIKEVDCLPWDRVCDGLSYCSRGEDEENCPLIHPTSTLLTVQTTTSVLNISQNSSTVIAQTAPLPRQTTRPSIQNSTFSLTTESVLQKTLLPTLESPTLSTIVTSPAKMTTSLTKKSTTLDTIITTQDKITVSPDVVSTLFEETILSTEETQDILTTMTSYIITPSTASPIPEKRYHCVKSHETIRYSQLCDAVKNCPHGDDELCNPKCPPDAFLCSEKCASKFLLCDEVADCLPAIDETLCLSKCPGPETFFCHLSNQSCIDVKLACDGILDCPVGEDEREDVCKTQCSTPNEFFCHKEATCISRELICDGTNDCLDGEDEKICHITPKLEKTTYSTQSPTTQLITTAKLGKICPSDYHLCVKAKRCIPAIWVCDGYEDCPKGEDEDNSICKMSNIITSVQPIIPKVTSEKQLVSRVASEQPVIKNVIFEQLKEITVASEKSLIVKGTTEGSKEVKLTSERHKELKVTPERSFIENVTSKKSIVERLTSEQQLIEKVTSEKSMVDRMTFEKSIIQMLTPEHPLVVVKETSEIPKIETMSFEESIDKKNNSHPQTFSGTVKVKSPIELPICLPKERLCPLSKMCISEKEFCDGNKQCTLGEDENNC